MDPHQIRMVGSLMVLWGLACATAPNATRAPAPCEQIKLACENAGFVQGGAKQGRGLWLDCVGPIMQGQPHQASRPLPSVDAQTVAACRAQERHARPPQTSAPAIPAASLPKPLARSSGKPNLVFILTDDLSLNLVPFMPHVLQMQKEGVTFANYFVVVTGPGVPAGRTVEEIVRRQCGVVC